MQTLFRHDYNRAVVASLSVGSFVTPGLGLLRVLAIGLASRVRCARARTSLLRRVCRIILLLYRARYLVRNYEVGVCTLRVALQCTWQSRHGDGGAICTC